MVSMSEFFFFVNYSMALFLLILVYCITGEFLITEVRILLINNFLNRNFTFDAFLSSNFLLEQQFAKSVLRVPMVRYADAISKTLAHLHGPSSETPEINCWPILYLLSW